MVIVEAILFVPEAGLFSRHSVERTANREIVLDELRREILVGWMASGELDRGPGHAQAVIRHPGRAVGLLQVQPRRHHHASVDHTDVVETEKTALEEVVS